MNSYKWLFKHSLTILYREGMNDSVFPDIFAVSVCDVEVVREGHQSEVLQSLAHEFAAECCFTLVFRGRRGNLDLVADSAEEAQSWIKGMRKLIENVENMGQREKLDQYPFNETENTGHTTYTYV